MIDRRLSVAAAAVNGLAVLALVACWYAAAGDLRASSQLREVQLAVVAAAVAAACNAGVVIVLRRAVVTRSRAVQRWAPVRSTPAVKQPRFDDEARVALSGGRFAHRESCALVRGKKLRPARASLEPCRVCSP